MRQAVLALIAVVTVLTGGVTAQQAARPDAELQAAIRTETVQGDLKAAIQLYEKLAKSSDRAVAAQALVRLGQCHERLGAAEARQAYERAVRDFADQAGVVATAQARLLALSSTRTGATYRQVWTGPKVDTLGGISPDGRYASCVDWDTGDLALHDFATDKDRHLTNKGSWDQSDEFAEETAISKDGRQVAYAWFNGKDRYELRVASIPATGFVQPKRLFDSEDIPWIGPYDWSPDGKWIVVLLQRKDRTGHIGLVSTETGSLRLVKQADGVSEVFFSPDGRHLGFDAITSGRPRRDRDVFVMAVDGTGETAVAANPAQEMMMGWSPDGRMLLFVSDRTGSMALWGVPIAEGKAQAPPLLLRPGIQPGSLGITASGTLYSDSTYSERDVMVASLDFTNGRVMSPPERPIETFLGSNTQPDWSPDGKYLAYISTRGRGSADRVLAIRSVETGQTRELRPNLRGFNSPRWAPDGLAFLCQGTDFDRRQGIFRIDAQTGNVSPLAISEPGTGLQMPNWSPDGKRIYYSTNGAILEKDLASGTVRELIKRKDTMGAAISPDGRYIAAYSYIRGSTPSEPSSTAVLLIPTAGGEPRELARVTAPEQFRPAMTWAPGGRGVIVAKFSDNGNRREPWLFPLEGGKPYTLDLAIDRSVGPMRVHPDGSRIAYVAGEGKGEVIALENFLPAGTAVK